MNKLDRLSRIILFIRVQFRTGAGRNQNIRILNSEMNQNISFRIQTHHRVIVSQNTRIYVHPSILEYKDKDSSQYPRIQEYNFILVSQNTRIYWLILVSQNTRIWLILVSQNTRIKGNLSFLEYKEVHLSIIQYKDIEYKDILVNPCIIEYKDILVNPCVLEYKDILVNPCPRIQEYIG